MIVITYYFLQYDIVVMIKYQLRRRTMSFETCRNGFNCFERKFLKCFILVNFVVFASSIVSAFQLQFVCNSEFEYILKQIYFLALIILNPFANVMFGMMISKTRSSSWRKKRLQIILLAIWLELSLSLELYQKWIAHRLGKTTMTDSDYIFLQSVKLVAFIAMEVSFMFILTFFYN